MFAFSKKVNFFRGNKFVNKFLLSEAKVKSNLCNFFNIFFKKAKIFLKKDGISQIIRGKDGNIFINLKHGYFPLNNSSTLMDYRQEIRQKTNQSLEINFFNKNYEEFSETTPLAFVIEDDFYLKLGNEVYFILGNPKTPFIDVSPAESNQDFIDLSSLNNVFGSNFIEKKTLQDFCSKLMKNSLLQEKVYLDSKYIKNSVYETINQISLKNNKEVSLLDFKINFLNKQLDHCLAIKKEIDEKIEKKSNRNIKAYLSFLFTQIILIQYGTYYMFSWDIMEPITCLLGVIDLIIPYYFWLRNEKDFSFESLKENFSMKKQEKSFRRNFGLEREIAEIQELLNILKNRKLFYSEQFDLKEFFSKTDK